MAVDAGARRRRRSLRSLPRAVGVPLLALLVGAGCWQLTSAAGAEPAKGGSFTAAQPGGPIESGRTLGDAGLDASGVAAGAAGKSIGRDLAIHVRVGLAHLAELASTLAPARPVTASRTADRSTSGQRAPPARLG